MIFCSNNTIKIESDCVPRVGAKIVLPIQDKASVQKVLKKPFVCLVNVNFFITYKDKNYTLFFPRGYTWDGATIPVGFRGILGGCGNPKFLVASMVHDKMCECKWLIDYDRKLSSLVFKELLLSCGCGKFKAELMFLGVDNFQRLLFKK